MEERERKRERDGESERVRGRNVSVIKISPGTNSTKFYAWDLELAGQAIPVKLITAGETQRT